LSFDSVFVESRQHVVNSTNENLYFERKKSITRFKDAFVVMTVSFFLRSMLFNVIDTSL